MRTIRVVLFVAALLGVAAGRANAADETLWALSSPTRAADCAYCHGLRGEGGFGPDLAGRAITLDQFKTAVRKPWGVMPAYPNLTDETLADLFAYLQSLPKVAQPAAWRVPVPGDATPKGQRTLVVFGCAQCHGTEMVRPRVALGGMARDVNFAAFSRIVYQHTELYERNMMGLFSRERLPEPSLRDIFEFVQAIGFRVPLSGAITAVTPAGANTTYTLTVANGGKAGKGLTAEDITISLAVPTGSTVVGTTGAGYQGVQRDAKRNADVAVWKLPRLDADAKLTYTLTLSGSTPASGLVKGASLAWSKPEFRILPNQIQDPSDEKRIPAEKGDAANITVKIASSSQ
jgi:mono/diheme cytochrome c family protein